MTSKLPEFVEIAGRLYEVVVVVGLIEVSLLLAHSHVDHASQQILISDEVDPADRANQLERAISAALGLGPHEFRMVPVRGMISTS